MLPHAREFERELASERGGEHTGVRQGPDMYIPNSHVVQPGAKEGAAEKEAVRLLRETMLTDLRPAHDGGPSAELDQERQHARREAETLQELQDVQARLLASAQTPHSGAAHEQEQLEARMYELLRLLDPADTMLPRVLSRALPRVLSS